MVQRCNPNGGVLAQDWGWSNTFGEKAGRYFCLNLPDMNYNILYIYVYYGRVVTSCDIHSFQCQLCLNVQFLLTPSWSCLRGQWVFFTCSNWIIFLGGWKEWNQSNLPSKPRCPTCPHAVQCHKRHQKMTPIHMPKNDSKCLNQTSGEERRGENLEDSHHLQRSSPSSYGGTGDGAFC